MEFFILPCKESLLLFGPIIVDKDMSNDTSMHTEKALHYL